jgi:recombinational DNA repair protein (RecF pathway)
MAHHIYSTEAFILASTAGKEADRRYALLTRELGLVWAGASGVRRSGSKLRYALQEFSCVHVSLVRGREVWRITNAVAGENLYAKYRGEAHALTAIAKLFKLITRMYPEGEKHERFFDDLSAAFDFLSAQAHANTSGSIGPGQAGAFEHVLAIRLLRQLGYIGEDAALKPFLTSLWSVDMLKDAHIARRAIRSAISSSLEQSQL